MRIHNLSQKISIETSVDFKNVSKEILQLNILDVLSNYSELYKNIIFQGGTALKLCYNLNRYSEDLYFTINKEGKRFINKLFDELPSKLKIDEKIEATFNSKGLMDVINIKVIPEERIKSINVKIEFMEVPSYSKQFRIVEDKYNFGIKDLYIPTESLEEILADKIVTLGGRPLLDSMPFKSRDIWDIAWLSNNNIVLNSDLISKKLDDYKISKDDFLKTLYKRLEFINLGKGSGMFYKNEMSRFVFGKALFLLNDEQFINSTFKEVESVAHETIKLLQENDLNKPDAFSDFLKNQSNKKKGPAL
ncbi:MAG: nucleotidyl transferase AbiEii/AbiGii toxin family protein [bacterium]